MEFLDTTATSYHIERLLKGARERVVIISPYLKFRPRIRELIEDAARRKVEVQIVYGKKEQCDEIERLRPLAGVSVTFCRNVHAKCYLNEMFGIITSLNLYDFSEAKNQEMGVLFQRAADHQLYQQADEEAQRIVRISGGSAQTQKPVAVAASETVQEPSPEYGKLTTAKLAAKLGVQTTQLFNKLIGRGSRASRRREALHHRKARMPGESFGWAKARTSSGRQICGSDLQVFKSAAISANWARAASRSSVISRAMTPGAGRLALSSRLSSLSQKMSRLALAGKPALRREAPRF